MVRYDEEFLSAPPSGSGASSGDLSDGVARDEERRRRGGTRQTKNIGLVVGLEFVDKPGKGLIIGTTHL